MFSLIYKPIMNLSLNHWQQRNTVDGLLRALVGKLWPLLLPNRHSRLAFDSLQPGIQENHLAACLAQAGDLQVVAEGLHQVAALFFVQPFRGQRDGFHRFHVERRVAG